MRLFHGSIRWNSCSARFPAGSGGRNRTGRGLQFIRRGSVGNQQPKAGQPAANHQPQTTMETSTPRHKAFGDTIIARAARELWQRAGWPPGRYIEYWTKVEELLTAAPNAEFGAFADAVAELGNPSTELPRAASKTRSTALPSDGSKASVTLLMHGNNGGKAKPPPVRPAWTRER